MIKVGSSKKALTKDPEATLPQFLVSNLLIGVCQLDFLPQYQSTLIADRMKCTKYELYLTWIS